MIGLYSYQTNNIGDDFQSYVIRNFLNIDAEYVNRDKAAQYQKAPLTLIANAFITRQALPLSQLINPIFVAVWLGPLILNDPEKVAFLKQHEPIGCRDKSTLARCRELNIDCYFSGCPTILCSPIADEVEIPGDRKSVV